ncbi:MAG TPA: zf-HC2 domain-containing protein [Acidobacteriaceae bacterium]|jgi:hypothetical protein|nr:zf-HC2 domain-containing protein [Acidobacteriaceae bacterium]
MAGEEKFGQKPGATLRCEEWEALLADALDGLLAAKEAGAFTAHSESCANCGDLLAHAQQGRDWLVYLHEEPDVPAGLVGKILEKTAGPGAMPVPVAVGAGPGAVAMAMPWRRSFHETRLLMTVAMAFFSIALTLNLAGVKLTTLRLADLRPAQIGSTISRQFYTGWGSVVRFYDNARLVYQLESRMRELRRDVETTPQQQPAQQQNQKKQEPPKQGGNSETAPGGGARLNASEVTGRRVQGTEEWSRFGVPGGEEENAALDSTEIETTTEAQVSAVDGNSISLGLSRTGLQNGYDGRSLV